MIILELALLTAAHAKQPILQQYLRTFKVFDKDGHHWEVIDPPKQWFQGPAPENITINIVPYSEVINHCEGSKETTRGNSTKKIIGCAVKEPRRSEYCDIFVDKDLTVQSRNIVIHHEKAHCHGWPHYHPTIETLPFPRPNPTGAARKVGD